MTPKFENKQQTKVKNRVRGIYFLVTQPSKCNHKVRFSSDLKANMNLRSRFKLS